MTTCDLLESQVSQARATGERLSIAAVAAITGTRIEDKQDMTVPKTELVSKLRLLNSPSAREHAPLAAILVRNNGELSAKALWNASGLEIDEFYRQLKLEMANEWIEEPEAAYVKEVEVA